LTDSAFPARSRGVLTAGASIAPIPAGESAEDEEIAMGEGIGDRFQRETKYTRAKIGGPPRGRVRPEAASKRPTAETRIRLDPPSKEDSAPIWDVLARRRSVRTFTETPLPLSHLSRLLWAAQGITKKIYGHDLRTAPSAGALYPVETYVAAQTVEGLNPGLYHYDIQHHALELISAGDFRRDVAEAALGQSFTASANVVFIWTAVFGRSKVKYRERAYRYVYLDAGHIAQNLALAAVALGLGSCQIAALFDDEVNALVGADGEEESVIYMTAVGRPSDTE
jgi:SagB-type dehydrogenase family enzyme